VCSIYNGSSCSTKVPKLRTMLLVLSLAWIYDKPNIQ
jgi:hypothetical protein